MNVDGDEVRGFIAQTVEITNDMGDVVHERDVVAADKIEIDLVDTLPVDGQTVTVTNTEVVLARSREEAVESLNGGDE